MILLYCEAGSSGEVALPAGLVEGRSAPERRYSLIEHFCAVEAGDELVTAHDADELVAHHHFRLASSAEQDAYAAKQKKAKRVQERAASASAPSEKVNGG